VIETSDEHAPFRCDISYVDDSAIVLPRGDIDIATAPMMLREALASLVLPVEHIVVDLRHVTFMDSSGIHALNTARLQAADRGTGFTLVAVPPQPRTVLEITGLAEAFGLLPRGDRTVPGTPPT
jgi:anti-sigma B factor antagonist